MASQMAQNAKVARSRLKAQTKGREETMNAAVKPQLARPDAATISAVTRALAARFGNRLVMSFAVREQHGHNFGWVGNEPPDAVVFAETTEDVADVVRLCAAHHVPVIAFGTGTSLEGHVNAP